MSRLKYRFVPQMVLVSLVLLIPRALEPLCRAADHQDQASKPTANAAIVIDRLVATVNNQPITQSEILWHMALDPEGPSGPPDPGLYSRVLHQVIDLKLLDQEAEKLPAGEITGQEIDRYIDNLLKQFPSEKHFRDRLAAVGLSAELLREQVKHRVEILHFVDFRFRAFVLVSPQEVERYYATVFVPAAREKGQAAPSLDQVSPVIERDIADQKVASEMTAWFEEARRRSEIVVLYQP